MSYSKYQFISEHQTLNGILFVDWSQEYHQEFQCPECSSDQLEVWNNSKVLEKCSLRCKSCKKNTKLSYQNSSHIFKFQPGVSCPNPKCTQIGPDGRSKGWIYLQAIEDSGTRSRYCCYYCKTRFGKLNKPYAEKQPLISYHQTLNGTLEVDWRRDYRNEYPCLKCGSTQNYPCYNPNYFEKRSFSCKKCSNQTPLTCRNYPYIFRYQPGLSCPNSGCIKIGPDGKTKGWLYLDVQGKDGTYYRCHYCNRKFNLDKKLDNLKKKQPELEITQGIIDWTKINSVKPFNFDEDIWDLRNFYEEKEVRSFTISFDFEPYWYKLTVKKYIHMLLKARGYALATIIGFVSKLKKFGRIVHQLGLAEVGDIDRQVIKAFINSQKNLESGSLNDILKHIKSFCEWLGLDTHQLIHRRDFLKERKSDVDWLDKTVRQEIRQHLDKIPAAIARQYLVQEYTAARPNDIRLMPVDCLIEENGQWYIQFYQHKVKRWHRVPANRQIRQIIEAQQQWIRQTLGNEYSYLFCHFYNLIRKDYPQFPTLMPVAKVPGYGASNVMVMVIRILIDREGILDSNGQKPLFVSKITRSSRLQEIRVKHGLNTAQLYADHKDKTTTLNYYAPVTKEQLAEVDLPFQELLLNPNNRFLPWQSLPESLLKNPKAHELDIEIAPRLVVYGHCALDPKTPCPINLYPKCYGCSSFRPSTAKLPLYERHYVGEQKRMQQAKEAEAELAYEEAKNIIEAMDKWLPELRKLAND